MRGRPVLGHRGHPGPLEGCTACWLIAWRQARGWTQSEAAALIPSGRRYSTPTRSYQEWERAGPPPGVLELLRALAGLEAPLETLFGSRPRLWAENNPGKKMMVKDNVLYVVDCKE